MLQRDGPGAVDDSAGDKAADDRGDTLDDAEQAERADEALLAHQLQDQHVAQSYVDGCAHRYVVFEYISDYCIGIL